MMCNLFLLKCSFEMYIALLLLWCFMIWLCSNLTVILSFNERGGNRYIIIIICISLEVHGYLILHTHIWVVSLITCPCMAICYPI